MTSTCSSPAPQTTAGTLNSSGFITEAPPPHSAGVTTDPLRGMPRSDDAERGVLSCFLQNPEELFSDARLILSPEAFYHAGNRLLFEELLAFEAAPEKKPLDLVTLSQWLLDRKLMDQIGGPATLAELYNFVPTPAHYSHYCGILRDKLLLRSIVKECSATIQACYEHEDAPREVASGICTRLLDTLSPRQLERRQSFDAMLFEYTAEFRKRMKGETDAALPSRWPSFNRTFGGITPTLWLISGYPSQGKSTLAQNLVEDVVHAGRQAAWYSYEMNPTECIDRLMVSDTSVDPRKIFFPKDHPPTSQEQDRITDTLVKMHGWGLHLRTDASLTIEDIDADVRLLKTKHDLALVVIDYAQLVPTSAKKFHTRAEEMAHVSRSCKRISRVHGVAIVLLSQQNDEGRTLDSRAFTQDASNYLILEDPHGDHEGGLRVTKNRNGQRGDLLPITLDGKRFQFVERAEGGGYPFGDKG